MFKKSNNNIIYNPNLTNRQGWPKMQRRDTLNQCQSKQHFQMLSKI